MIERLNPFQFGSFGPEQGEQGEAESIMLFEIERISNADEIESLRRNIVEAVDDVCASAVSYTHLDVYKRQRVSSA